MGRERDSRVNRGNYSLTNMLYSDRKRVKATNATGTPHLIQFARLSRLASSFTAAS